MERLQIRKYLILQYPKDVIGITDYSDARIRLTVEELYSYLFKTYLPGRCPSSFKTMYDKTDRIARVKNLVTGHILPADAKSSSMSWKAYSECFPSGFQPRDKIGKIWVEIHGQVPKYKEKLQKSMDRFFDRLEAGRLVKRLVVLYFSTPIAPVASQNKQTFLRSERQTLHRLLVSDAIVFAFHTYLYSIQKIKAEGSSEDLASAIDGLQCGRVPEIFTYKNGEN
ncbi:uncharacterized protein N7477_005863 [Penicillium maclennaniae]|uniref:uncharacterized protein n=1 Tax=Penicillium maclennaniae TaxID=1343394 RepID=UPI002541BC7B|nr:uncharacterized protein N7477_005863 [Penicillium maclennaniae]KAJ5670500.1 hypothetical protein N7477_005863 [Penicillium maclennaniae]